jgi:glycosyltransferase involved in cell wall biosynthesis
MMNEAVSIIVRTMPGREKFLDKCLFVLAGQNYSPIEVVIVAQALRDTDSFTEIKSTVERWHHWFWNTQVICHVSATDARARGLNLGKHAAQGRYLAFLDDDDKVYPNHYARLIEPLGKTDFAWAYGDIIRALYNEHGQLVSRSAPFKRDAYSFLDHLRGNTTPIHSFVMDAARTEDVGDVDESLSRGEDYEFILRLAYRHEPLYVPGFGAEYCIRNDGSNTVSDGVTNTRDMLKKRRLWREAEDAWVDRKVKNFGWWIRELEQLPLIYPVQSQSVTYPEHAVSTSHHEADVYQQMLAEYYASTSWRVMRPLRNIVNKMRGLPKEQIVIPRQEELARQEIAKILRSTSWEITAPLRLAKRLMSRKERAASEQAAIR